MPSETLLLEYAVSERRRAPVPAASSAAFLAACLPHLAQARRLARSLAALHARDDALRRTLARIRRRRAADAETTVTGSTVETAAGVTKAAVASVAQEAGMSVSKKSAASTPAPTPQRYAPPPMAAKKKPTAPPRAGTPIPTPRRVSTEVGFARETKARISIFDDDYVRFAIGRPPAAVGAASNRKLIRFAGRPSAHALV